VQLPRYSVRWDVVRDRKVFRAQSQHPLSRELRATCSVLERTLVRWPQLPKHWAWYVDCLPG
jgi:hypothetical protein